MCFSIIYLIVFRSFLLSLPSPQTTQPAPALVRKHPRLRSTLSDLSDRTLNLTPHLSLFTNFDAPFLPRLPLLPFVSVSLIRFPNRHLYTTSDTLLSTPHWSMADCN